MNTKRQILEFTEQLFTVISLFIFSRGLLLLLMSGGASEGDNQIVPVSNYALLQPIYRIIYLLTFILLIKQWQKVIKLVWQEKLICMLIMLAFISILWSIDLGITFKRSIALIGTTLFGIYFATRYTIKQQIQLLGWTFALVIGLSFLLILLFPKYGIMGGVHTGIWRGIYIHKNILGSIMLLSMLTYFMLAMNRKHQIINFSGWFGYGLSLFLLVFSTSKSALIIAVIIFTVLCLYGIWQHYYTMIVPSLIAILVATGSLLLQVKADIYPPLVLSDWNSTVVELNGDISEASKPPSITTETLTTLSSRTLIWSAGLEMFNKRPWLGYGYAAFWENKPGSPSAQIENSIGWNPVNGHNGSLDLSLELGLVGLSIFIVGYLLNLKRIIVLIMINSRNWAVICLLLFNIFIFFVNLTESNLLQHNNFIWVLYVSTVISILMYQNESRVREG